jgi:hydrogenase expression/formation protein HypC
MCLGIPGRIVAVTDAQSRLALVDVLGVRREINIAFIIDEAHPALACVGDWVLIHVGFAMGRIDEREAQLTLDVLRQLGEAQNEIDAMRNAEGPLAGPARPRSLQ